MTATIYQQDGSTSFANATFEQLYANPGGTCPAYTGPQFSEHYSASGQDRTVQYPGVVAVSHEGAWPMASILACLDTPVPLAAVTGGVEVVGSGSSLTPTDLRTDGGNDYQDHSATPIIFSGGTNYEYHRPSKGDGDANGDDAVTTNSAIAINVYTGTLYEPHPTASPSRVDVNQPVTFSPGVTGSGLSYAWTFSDGRSSTAPQPILSFSQSGTVSATVQVADGHGGGGIGRVTVTVAGGPVPTPTAGPTRAGPPGGSPGPAPSGTAAPHNRSPGKQNGHGKRPSTSPGAKGGKRTSPQATPQPTPAAPSPSGGTSSGSGPGGSATGAGGSNAGAQGGAGHRKPTTANRQRRQTVPNTGLEHVTGRLVSDVIPLSAATSPLVTETGAPPGSAPAERIHKGTSAVPAVIGGALAVLVLLALGAARELDVRWRALLPRVGS